MSKTERVERFLRELKNNCLREKRYTYQELYTLYCEWYEEKFLEKPVSNGFGMSLKMINLLPVSGHYIFKCLSEKEQERVKKEKMDDTDRLYKELKEKLKDEENTRQEQEDSRRKEEDVRREDELKRREKENERRGRFEEIIMEKQTELMDRLDREVQIGEKFWKKEDETYQDNFRIKEDELKRVIREKEEQKALRLQKRRELREELKNKIVE